MARNFKELEAKMSPVLRARIRKRAKQLIDEAQKGQKGQKRKSGIISREEGA